MMWARWGAVGVFVMPLSCFPAAGWGGGVPGAGMQHMLARLEALTSCMVHVHACLWGWAYQVAMLAMLAALPAKAIEHRSGLRPCPVHLQMAAAGRGVRKTKMLLSRLLPRL